MEAATSLRVEDVDEMWGRLDRVRKGRIWFGDDVNLLNALCAAQESLRTVIQEVVASEIRANG